MLGKRSDAMSEGRCEWHLDNWAQWMSERGSRLGYPSRASGRMGKSSSTDFDTMVRSADVRCAIVIDVLIDDLPRVQRSSVYTVKLAEAWKYRYDVNLFYDEAVRVLARELTRRGIM